jgi:hypothetical protein
MSSRGSRGWGVFLLLALVGMGLTFLAAVLDQSRFINNPLPAMLGLVGAGVMAVLFLGPVGKVIARMLEGDTRPDEELTMRLEDVEARLAELALEQQRVGELEERLDFTERLVAQQAAPVARRLPEES